MKRTIENEFIKAVVSDHGAELVSLVNLETGEELLWQADPAFWGRHAPVLFPYVGKLFEDEYLLNGEVYSSKSQHGFARDKDFDCVEEGNALSFALESDDETKESYPFDFSLNIRYELEGRALKIIWEVSNRSEKPMYFTIGAHPAFNTIPSKSDYSLYFPGNNVLRYHFLNTDYGCAMPEIHEIELDDHRLSLNDEMFEKDALIFDDSQIEDCILEHNDGRQILALHSPGFTNYGIWSKPGAPFVCLEPWSGRTDDMNFKEDISKKPNINTLEPGETFTKHYYIEVLKNE